MTVPGSYLKEDSDLEPRVVAGVGIGEGDRPRVLPQGGL